MSGSQLAANLFASALEKRSRIAYGGGGSCGSVSLPSAEEEGNTLKHLLKTIGFATAVAVLMGSAGAGASGAPVKRGIDVSTAAAVKQYLRSIGVSPSRVVIQRGVRNYAGARCPGKNWTCTSTSHPVVQVAAAGGKNYFQCTTGSCAVVQVAAAPSEPNVAKCIRTTGITQSCSINQTGTGPNTAIVVEIATKTSGLTQNASQTAQIVQTAGSGANTACVLQRTTIEGSTVARRGVPVNVNLNAHQSIAITQDSLSGGNTVQNATSSGGGACAPGALDQGQRIRSKATGTMTITQNENATDTGPNQRLDIAQNQGSAFFGSATGENSAKADQTNTLTAIAVGQGPVDQTQSSPNGGIQARVNQFSHDLSTAVITQTENQCVHAQTTDTSSCPGAGTQPASLTQVQYGPVRKGECCSVQGDNPNNVFTVTQSSTQDSNDGSTQTNTVEGECSTSGNCTVTQQTDINGQQSTNTQTGQNVNAETRCSGSSCTTFTVDGDQLAASKTNVKEFGFGGMRGNGNGSIAVSDVTGPVARAMLYWNGPTNSSDPAANAAVTFNGTPVAGTNIGFASDNCWSFQNSQSYQADVTALVTGNGTYSLSDFNKPPDVEINGASLVVFYNDIDTSNDRNVTLWSGNDSNIASTFEPAGWDETLTGVQYPGSGAASLDFIVSDGQVFADDALVLNGIELVPAGNIFQGDSTPAGPGPPPPDDVNGRLWDVKSYDITSFLTPGSNDLHLTSGTSADCLSLVVLAANVPASAPVILGPASAAKNPAALQAQTVPAQSRSTAVSTGHGAVAR
jgi:hypothetical protein